MLSQRQIIAQAVILEQHQRGIGTAEIAALSSTEKTVPETDDAQYGGYVDARDEGKQTGVATQIVAELAECAQAFLGLGYKVSIALKDTEAEGIVDMADGDTVLTEGLPQKHVLVAIMAETLVEGVLKHQVATHKEISGVEVLVGTLLSFGGSVTRGFGLLVTVAQVSGQTGIVADGYTTVDHCIAVGIEVSCEEEVVDHRHIAVDEEDMATGGLRDEEVADGSAPYILLTANKTAVGHVGNSTVGRE